MEDLPKGAIWRKNPVTFHGASHPMYAPTFLGVNSNVNRRKVHEQDDSQVDGNVSSDSVAFGFCTVWRCHEAGQHEAGQHETGRQHEERRHEEGQEVQEKGEEGRQHEEKRQHEAERQYAETGNAALTLNSAFSATRPQHNPNQNETRASEPQSLKPHY